MGDSCANVGICGEIRAVLGHQVRCHVQYEAVTPSAESLKNCMILGQVLKTAVTSFADEGVF